MVFSIESFTDMVRRGRKTFKNELGEEDYLTAVQNAKRYSGNLSDLQREDLNNIISLFLNTWGQCRIPWKEKAIQNRLRELNLSSFDSRSLAELVGFEKEETIEFIEQSFERISSLKLGRRTFGPTATAKLFHLIVPDYFVMWDELIREQWGCAGNARGYSNFLLRMAFMAKQLHEARWSEKTLTRDLDIYNYILAHHPTKQARS